MSEVFFLIGGSIDNIQVSLIQDWNRTDNKPLQGPMLTKVPTITASISYNDVKSRAAHSTP